MGFKIFVKYHGLRTFVKYHEFQFFFVKWLADFLQSLTILLTSHFHRRHTTLGIGSMATDDSPSKESQFSHTYVYYIQGEETLNKALSSSYSSIISSITLLPQLGN